MTLTVLERLIAEQRRDDTPEGLPDYIYPPSRERILGPMSIGALSDKIQAKHFDQGRVTWGEPARNAAAVIDHCCPLCGARHPVYENQRLIAGLSKLFQNGRLVGGLCAGGNGLACSWSYGQLDFIAAL